MWLGYFYATLRDHDACWTLNYNRETTVWYWIRGGCNIHYKRGFIILTNLTRGEWNIDDFNLPVYKYYLDYLCHLYNPTLYNWNIAKCDAKQQPSIHHLYKILRHIVYSKQRQINVWVLSCMWFDSSSVILEYTCNAAFSVNDYHNPHDRVTSGLSSLSFLAFEY